MEQQSLIDVVNSAILNSSNQIRVSPSWVANSAYKSLDPTELAPYRARLAATEHLKQLARQQLRGKFDPKEDETGLEQHDLFPDLQRRYPIKHESQDGDPIYVNLEDLTDPDIQWNVQRLRREATTKQKHAAALEQWAAERRFKRAA